VPKFQAVTRGAVEEALKSIKSKLKAGQTQGVFLMADGTVTISNPDNGVRYVYFVLYWNDNCRHTANHMISVLKEKLT
jgi:hypothetical protein